MIVTFMHLICLKCEEGMGDTCSMRSASQKEDHSKEQQASKDVILQPVVINQAWATEARKPGTKDSKTRNTVPKTNKQRKELTELMKKMPALA